MANSEIPSTVSVSGRQFRLAKQLGLPGATATVYLGYEGEKEFAVKIMRPELSENMQARFHAESILLRRLASEEEKFGTHYIPRLIVADRHANPPILVMEYATGENLKDLLDRDERLREPEALAIAEQFVHMLQVIHHAGITYQDMKIDNIFWDRQRNQIKVIDWNVVEEDNLEAGVPRDLLRFSTYVYRMLTGKPLTISQNQIVENIKSPSEWQKRSWGTQRILERALRSTPSQRYENAELYCHDLHEQRVLFDQEPQRIIESGKQHLERLNERSAQDQTEEDRRHLQKVIQQLDVALHQLSPDDPAYRDLQDILQQAHDRLKNEPPPQLNVGRQRLKSKLYDAAILSFREVLEAYPTHREARWRLRMAEAGDRNSHLYEKVAKPLEDGILGMLAGGPMSKRLAPLSMLWMRGRRRAFRVSCCKPYLRKRNFASKRQKVGG